MDPKSYSQKNLPLPDEVGYGMVIGRVKPELHELSSNYDGKRKGVIRVLEVKEHGTNFRGDIKTDTVKTLSKSIDFEPFKIQNSQLEVNIDKPLDANYLLENLHRSYTHFDMNQSGTLTKVAVAIFAKESVKGTFF